MNHNKKGFVVTFLVGLLLTAIIFVPTCLFVSEFFRTSSQAKDNFDTFMKDFTDLADDKIVAGARKSALLILDAKTAVVYFSSEKMVMNILTDDSDTLTVKMNRPSKCKNEKGEWFKSCFCLVRDAVVEEKDDTYTILPNKYFCKGVNFKASFAGSNCGIGDPVEVKSYNCYDGFIIERELFSENDIDSYYKTYRRVNVVLEKTAEGITLSDSLALKAK